MLTSELSIVEYKKGRAFTDCLTQKTHGHYIEFALQMLSVYANGIGRERRQLHKDIEKIFHDEPDCPIRRIAAFCKLLDDKSTYQSDPQGRAGKLRLKVFSKAADFHPLVNHKDQLFEYTETAVKQQIAKELEMPWQQIQKNLYADVMEYQRLEKFEGFTDPAAFLAHYNVAQLQASL